MPRSALLLYHPPARPPVLSQHSCENLNADDSLFLYLSAGHWQSVRSCDNMGSDLTVTVGALLIGVLVTAV